MKKTLKVLAAVLTVILLCLSFCGCNSLDKLKLNHAFYRDDGSITLGTTQYILLTESEQLNPIVTNYDDCIYATQKDVPVLLSGFLGDEFYLSDNSVFLVSSYDYGICYCRADMYQSVTERIANGFEPECYRYEYYDYDTDTNKYYKFTDAQKNTFDNVLSQVKPDAMPKLDVVWDYQIVIDSCSEDMMFSEYIYDICIADGKYYIVEYDDEETWLYTVPDSMSEDFKAIISDYIEAESFWYDEDEPYSYEDSIDITL